MIYFDIARRCAGFVLVSGILFKTCLVYVVLIGV